MKRITSILMALILVLGLSTTAFATTITINDGGGRNYEGYQILKLTTSLKCKESHTHGDSCYAYAYTVNETYRAILQTVTGKTSDEDIVKYLEGQTGDDVDTNGTIISYGSLRGVADNIYRAIKAAGLEADKSEFTGANSTIDQGYWLIADVTDLNNAELKANSLVMVGTAGQTALNITPKTDLPTIEKKVKDIKDSEDNDIDDNAWQDSADHDIGDTVPFKLTATLPDNLASYDTYKIVFHDTLSEGLTLDEDSIKVFLNSENGKEVTGSFDIDSCTDGCNITIGCTDVLDIVKADDDTAVSVDKDTVFVVTYNATLNENAVIGAEGNPNEVYLEYSNNPYDEGTGKTKEDKVIVFTYKVVVNKTDADGNALKGADFTLYKKNSDGDFVEVDEDLKRIEDDTTFTWTGLDDGEYKLEESTVPDGYNKMEDIEFTISATHSETDDTPELLTLDGGDMGTGVVDVDTGKLTGAIEKDIINQTGTVLPETGARGTMMLIGGGAMFVVLAAVFMVTRKKMSIYAD